MFGASAIGLWQFTTLQAEAQRLSVVNAQANAVLRVHNTVLKVQNQLEPLATNQETGPFVAQALTLNQEILTTIDEAISLLGDSPDDRLLYSQQLSELASINLSFPEQLNAMIDLANDGDWLAVNLRLENQLQDTQTVTEQLAQDINQSVSQRRQEANLRMEQASRVVLITTSIAAMTTLLVATGLAFYVTRSIVRPVSELDKGARAWARGEFGYTVNTIGYDELANLSQVFNDGSKQLAQLYYDAEEVIEQRTQELRRRALQLETNMAVGQRVASILDLDTLLNEVAQIIQQRYSFYYVGVFMIEDKGQTIVAKANAARIPLPEKVSKFKVKVGEQGIIGWVAANKQPTLVEDVSLDRRFYYWDAMPDTKSELALPLRLGHKILGVLDVQSDEVNGLTEDDVPVMQSLADQVAIAIQNALLYKGEQTQKQLAQTLQNVGRGLTSTLNMNEVLDLILQHLHEIVPYDRASILLRRGNLLEFVAARGYGDNTNMANMHVKIDSADDSNVSVRIYKTRKPFVIPNLDEYVGWNKVEGLANPKSWLGVPLIHNDDILGMLSLARLKDDPYNQEDVRLTMALGDQAVIALQNAELYERIKRFSEQMEYEVQNRTKALQAAYSQLEQLDRTKSSFISIASHELRTPITVLKGYSQVLLRDATLTANERHKSMIQGVENSADRLHAIVDSMLDMAKLDNQTLQLHLESLSMLEMGERVHKELAEDLGKRQLTLVLDPGLVELPAVEADREAIRKVFYHLVVNAIKYTPDGGKITISGRGWTDKPEKADWPKRGVLLSFQDTGIGIDPQNQDLIFNKFYQTGEVTLHSSGRTKFKGGGPGLGLAITQGIVTVHKGKLWVESPGYDEEKCPGSTFFVLLPLSQYDA
jgi:signal transduction histidine kinase/nitrate/nitrite-specific signal transduction histidine kinase